jgi:hypothetical protein
VWELTPSKSLEVSNKRTGQLRLNVQLTDINQKLRDGRYYRVAVRRLQGDRSPAMIASVLQLKKRLEAQGYSLFLNDFLQGGNAATVANEDLSAYFSAELLASAYKSMGLIGSDESLSAYGPQFWLQPGDIPLQGGILGPCVAIERSFEPLSKTYLVKDEVGPDEDHS